MIADPKPLILGEFGIDSLREGEMRQSHVLSWQIESVFRHGLAGAVVYSFTDEWYKGGRELVEWGFGLTTRERRPKTAFAAVQKGFSEAPCFPLTRYPLISVVVACYNGGPTVRTCLDSLQRLNYPAYEVILVDDGSTDDTAQIAADFKNVRLVQHTANLGLSEARNSGIAAAQGEIIAFIDADCRANSDWLYYLAGGLLSGEFAGIGGPNLLPPDDSCVAAVVMVSPGGPAHVMHSDRVAEHVPGCNMAFYKWVLKEIGGFDPVFRRAGDDVDLCWRLQQRGYTLGFSPAGFVWHYRRSTVCAYLRQQHGYGEAEALLASKHPEHFSGFGGGIWRGRIYSAARFGLVFRRPRIYHGRFGSGFFQSLYRVQPEAALMLFTSLEYQALVTLPLCVLAMAFEFLIVPALVSLLIPVTVCAAAAIQAELPRKKRRFWSRPLVACMFFLQPLVRGWARYGSRLSLRARSLAEYETLDSLSRKRQKLVPDQMQYWGDKGVDRLAFLACAMRRLELQGWPGRSDAGWHNYDLEIAGNLWSRLQLTTVAEAHGGGKYLIRCRLRRAWTFLARVVFCGVLGAELLAVGFWDYAIVWHWLMLLSLAGLAWWLRHQGRNLQRLIGVFLDEVAQQLQLTKIEPCPRKDSTGPGDDNHC
jgi:GT2 family glycosyltransferase